MKLDSVETGLIVVVALFTVALVLFARKEKKGKC